MSSLNYSLTKTFAIFAVSVLVLAGNTHLASASTSTSGGFGSSINDYVHSRLCERFGALRVGRPYISLPKFCTDSHVRPSVDISASPHTITVGQSTMLSWTSGNATSCTASGSWSGSKVLNGSESVSPATTTTFILSCANAVGNTSDSVTIQVNPVPQQPGLAFSANPTTITHGSTTLLTWSSIGTTGCNASLGWSGTKAVSGSQTFSPATTTDYGITCTGAGGTISGTTTVTVVPAAQPMLTFSAFPPTILMGATSTLTWNSSNTSSCIASGGWGGAKVLSGNSTVTPATTTTYVLTCHGLGGHVQATTTIAVTPLPMPSVTLIGTPGTIANGATSTLSWSSTNASSCAATGGWSGAKGLSGTQIVSPATTTVYVLNCIGSGGTGAATTTVVVTAAPMPTLTFSATPATTTATSTLTWTSMHTTSCIASLGWSGSSGLSGTLIVSPATTTMYVLDCHGLGGHVQGTTTVHVATSTLALTSAVQETNRQSFAASFDSDVAVNSEAPSALEGGENVADESVYPAGAFIERLRSDIFGRTRR